MKETFIKDNPFLFGIYYVGVQTGIVNCLHCRNLQRCDILDEDFLTWASKRRTCSNCERVLEIRFLYYLYSTIMNLKELSNKFGFKSGGLSKKFEFKCCWCFCKELILGDAYEKNY